MMRWYTLLGVAVLFNGVANVLMKAGMLHAPESAPVAVTIKHYLTSLPLLVGLALFGLNVIAYTQALTKIPLSVAYPIMVSMSFLIIISGSALLFKEAISTMQWLGFAMIIGGVICVTR